MSAEVVTRTSRGYVGGAARPRHARRLLSAPALTRSVAWVALALAGWIHVVASWSHLQEWVLLGWGMSVIGLLQLATAWLVRSGAGAPGLLAAGVLLTIAALVFYVMTRTGDVPFLPAHVGHENADLTVPRAIGDGVPDLPGARTEPVGLIDGVCAAAQLAGVLTASVLLTRRWLDVVTACAAAGAVGLVVWRLVA